MSTAYIKIETIQSGQPEPYADHEYVEEISFTRDDYRDKEWLKKQGYVLIVPDYRHRKFALSVARLFCPWTEPGDVDYDWASRHFVSFERLEPTPRENPSIGDVTPDFSDRWRIHVRSTFTD